MNIYVKRLRYTSKSTIGEMWIEGVLLCYTLEDTVRKDGVKIFGSTAIPEGTYKCAVDYSDRLKTLMVRIRDVPGFEGILIHRGNSDVDTIGCVLVGSTPGIDTILDSVLAYAKFCRTVVQALSRKEDISIEIVNIRERPAIQAVA